MEAEEIVNTRVTAGGMMDTLLPVPVSMPVVVSIDNLLYDVHTEVRETAIGPALVITKGEKVVW